MNIFLYLTAAGLLAAGSTTAVAQPWQGLAQQWQQLRSPLNQMVLKSFSQNSETPPGQIKRPDDPDQGDDNAALRAIFTVCTMDNPAARRSAICDGRPISPQ